MPLASRAAAFVLALALLVPAVALGRGAAGPAYLLNNVRLTGQAETPKGDPDGSGSVSLCVETMSRSLAFKFGTLRKIGRPNAGHIHRGAVGKAGPVVLPFPAPAEVWAGTTTVAPGPLTAMLQHPSRYYVNVHTKAYPGGALRGQLGPWKKAGSRDIAVKCGF